MHIRDPGVEETIETFDQAEDLNLELVGPNDRTVDGSVHRWRVATRGQDTDASHERFYGRTVSGPLVSTNDAGTPFSKDFQDRDEA